MSATSRSSRTALTASISETIKNPKLLLDKIKKEKSQISDLIEQGETEKADELKQNIAWKKAFDKTEGKKVGFVSLFTESPFHSCVSFQVKDNLSLLHKTLHKRKVDKKKTKVEWKERQAKVEKGIEQRQKKRQENIDKKIEMKKKSKLKQSAKRGRVIAGY